MKLTTLEDMWKFAQYVHKAGIRKRTINSAEQAFCIIQYGDELGIGPMASIKGITFKGDMPTVDGDLALGLVRNSGLCEYVKESFENGTATCIVKRQDQDTSIKRQFSHADAQKAKLIGKPGPWSQYEERMKRYRALGFALRDSFPEVMNGIHITQEIEEDTLDPPTCNTPKRQDRRTVESQEVTSQEEPTTPPADTDGITEEDAGGTSEEDFLDTTYEPVVDDDEPGSEAALALLPSVKDAFFEMLGKNPEDCEKPNVMFVATCAMALSCPEEDCNRPDKFSVNMLNKVQGWIDSQKDGE